MKIIVEIGKELSRKNVTDLLLWASTFATRFRLERGDYVSLLTFSPRIHVTNIPEFLNEIENKLYELNIYGISLKGIECDEGDTKSLKVLKLYKKIEGRKK